MTHVRLPDTDTKKKRYSIKAVENALVVMEALSELEEDVNLSQLSKRLGMNKSYIFRLLATFEQRGYVEKEKKTGKYRLGLSAYEIGQKFLSRMHLLRKARPFMETLARECHEAVYLAVLIRHEVLLLEMVDTAQQVKIIPLVGKRYPSHQTSAGNVIRAFMNEPQNWAAGKDLPVDFDLIRQHEGCFESGGFGSDISSAAVPIFNSKKEVLGALCILGPAFRFEKTRVEKKILPRLKAAGEGLSSNMGYLDELLN